MASHQNHGSSSTWEGWADRAFRRASSSEPLLLLIKLKEWPTRTEEDPAFGTSSSKFLVLLPIIYVFLSCLFESLVEREMIEFSQRSAVCVWCLVIDGDPWSCLEQERLLVMRLEMLLWISTTSIRYPSWILDIPTLLNVLRPLGIKYKKCHVDTIKKKCSFFRAYFWFWVSGPDTPPVCWAFILPVFITFCSNASCLHSASSNY